MREKIIKYTLYIIIQLSLPGLLLCQSGLLEIHHINVQQGDCILIIGPNGTTALVDAGKNGKGNNEVVPYLKSIGIMPADGLDYMIATHMDADHVGGLDEVIKAGYDVKQAVYDNGSIKTTSTITDYRNATSGTAAGSPVWIMPGIVIDLGMGAKITCAASRGEVVGLGLVEGATESENDMSVVLLVEYGNFDYILGGDLGGGKEDYACTGRSTSQHNVETPIALAITPDGITPLLSQEGVDVLHVNHHGSAASMNSDYMNLLKPEVATINVGVGQSSTWHHPRKVVVENVLGANVDCIDVPPAVVYQTEEGHPVGSNTSYVGYCIGDIVIKTSGYSVYEISGTGEVSQGPDERADAGLPREFPIDEVGAVEVSEIGLDHVVFTEVFYDPKGRREAKTEWLEIYNSLFNEIDISGWRIIDDNGSGGKYIFPQGTVISGHSYLVVARDKRGFQKTFGEDPDISGLSISLNNDGDCLLLKDGSIIVDAVAWEGGASHGIPDGWGSPTEPVATERTSIQRKNLSVDLDTYEDWESNQTPSPGE